MTKTFYSIDAWKKCYFPKAYRREKLKRIQEKLGFGVWLAKHFLARVKRRLAK